MVTKIISITTLSLFALISLGINQVNASEITGSLSTGLSNINSSTPITGSLSGSVVSASTLSGTVSNNNSGRSGGSSGSSRSSTGEVLGASTDNTSTTYPGLPNTGMATDMSVELALLIITILVISTLPIRYLSSMKS